MITVKGGLLGLLRLGHEILLLRADSKYQSMQYQYVLGPACKKFGTQMSAGKSMLTVFWGSRNRVCERDL
jgi:hypothetical protein